MQIGQGGGGDAGREGRGVELVVGVEDQGGGERLGGQRGGLLAAHHVEEVAGEVELRARGDRRLAAADALPRRDQRGELRGEAQGLSKGGLAAVVGRVGI